MLPADWVWKTVMTREVDDTLKICAGVWLIWRHRNEVWHDKDYWEVSWTARKVELCCRQWRSKCPLINTEHVSDPLKWRPPKMGYLKINCEGAWSVQSNSIGVGCIVRDGEGIVRGAFATWILKRKGSELEAEGRAILQAMEAAELVQWDKVLFESDSIQAILGILAGVMDDEYSRQVWGSRCSELLSRHPEWEISHVWREANKGADLLAKKGM
ncbi:unnamed protein product [Rhodiola kirilowii]